MYHQLLNWQLFLFNCFKDENSIKKRPICDKLHPELRLKKSNLLLFGGSMERETYPIEIAGVNRNLRLFEIKPGLRIAILNILGDTELVTACGRALAEKLQKVDYDVLVTAEAKSIPLAHALSVETNKPYVVLRKRYKPYMGEAMRAETLSITTGEPQTLYLDEKDQEIIHHKRAIILDDVISTGSTLQGMRLLLQKAGANVVAEAAILTEGERAKWADIISLGHIPVFTD
jgi:adenine phosphoribosyltransferase